MIVKCILNDVKEVPEVYLTFGPDYADHDHLAVSIGKNYAVYAVRKDNDAEGQWYFIYTDNGYLWWMPAISFEVVESSRPTGWIEKVTAGDDTMQAYPSLYDWEVEEGIIDFKKESEEKYLSEVRADPSFPVQVQIDSLNLDFEKKKQLNQYEEDLQIAKEKGWERPPKPQG